ncbi:MAG: hypothetical protein ACREOH_07115, partial [Candidatus Entotheonellia bacterium]
ESEGISLEDLRVLTERAGFSLSREELASLQPMYEHFAGLAHTLYEVPLEAEDVAVTYSPNWDSQS